MDIAADLGDVQALGPLLQNRLQSHLPGNLPIQIQCALKQGTLMILGQHPANIDLETQQIFDAIERVLYSLQPIFEQPFNQTVRLYLRIAGQKQPYAFHAFKIQPISPTATTAIDLEMEEAEDFLGPTDALAATQVPHAATVPNGYSESYRQAYLDEPDDTEDDLGEAPTPVDLEEPHYNPFDSAAVEESELEPELESSALVKSSAKPSKSPGRRSLPLLVAGASAGVLVLGGVVYALTRPCVIGGCARLETAQQLSQEAGRILEQPKSVQDLVTAKQKLTEASNLLQPIPSWSSHHQQAQTLQQNYQAQSQALDQVSTAQTKASTAAQKSQNPPHPIETWQEIQGLWREAIAQLEAVPKDSTAYPLAQKKITEYKANLLLTNKRIQQEQTANNKLKQAKTTAQVAEAREGIAKSLETWQVAHSTWQVAIANLRQIPKSTMAYTEAQQLLTVYQPKLTSAQNRKTQEQIAANAYNQAIDIARQAKVFEQQNQWSQAVSSWRRALTYAKQVPTGTIYYNQAQPLVGTYAGSLSEAEDKLRLASILESARADLRRTCAGAPRICDFTVSLTMIKVRLNPDYVRMITRTAITAQTNGDINTQVDLTTHLQTLEAALEAISENSRIPIELYDANDSLLGRYVPSL